MSKANFDDAERCLTTWNVSSTTSQAGETAGEVREYPARMEIGSKTWAVKLVPWYASYLFVLCYSQKCGLMVDGLGHVMYCPVSGNNVNATVSLSDVFASFGLQTLLWKHYSACC